MSRRFESMELAGTEAINARDEALAIEGRINSQEISALNDLAQLEIYGDGGRTWVDGDGEVLAGPEKRYAGRIEALRNDRSGGRMTEKARNERADKYEASINGLLGEGFELTQAKLIMDLREEDEVNGASMLNKRLIERGSLNPGDLESAAGEIETIYAKKDQKRLQLIRDKGIFSADEYEAFIAKTPTPQPKTPKTLLERIAEYTEEQERLKSEQGIDGNNESGESIHATSVPVTEEVTSQHPATQVNNTVPATPVRARNTRQEGIVRRNWRKIAVLGAGAIALATGVLGVFGQDNDRNDSAARSFVDRSGWDSGVSDDGFARLVPGQITNGDWKAIGSESKSDKSEKPSDEQNEDGETDENSAPTPEQIAAFNEAVYGNIDTGDNAQHLLGNFEIDPANPEASVENFYKDLRSNPENLAFWEACVATNTPSYKACVKNENVLNLAEAIAVKYRNMGPEEKGRHAEALIEQFRGMRFDGIVINSGAYRTHGVSADGTEFYAMNNSRQNDPWLKFTYTDDKGKEHSFFIRGCGQIVEDIEDTPKKSAPSKPKAPKTPVEEGLTPKKDTNITPGGVEGANGGGQSAGVDLPVAPPETTVTTDPNSNTGTPSNNGGETNPNQGGNGAPAAGPESGAPAPANSGSGNTNPGNV